jgi:hypothetical protein
MSKAGQLIASGLTAGMYFKDGCQVDPPDSHAGLYIKSRDGTEVKVVITGDQLLFQFGEVIQVLPNRYRCYLVDIGAT